jgi:hypothetical protein
MRKKFKLRSDGGDSGSKKYKRSYGEPLVGSDGVWNQVVGFVLVHLAGI